MRRHAPVAILLTVVAVFFVCTPSGRPTMLVLPTPTAESSPIPEGTPSAMGPAMPAPMGGSPMQDQIRHMGEQLREAQARVPARADEQHRENAEQMASLVYLVSDLLLQLDRTAERLTPQQQQAVAAQFVQIRTTLLALDQAVGKPAQRVGFPPLLTPTPLPTDQPDGFRKMSHDLKDMHQRLRYQVNQLDQARLMTLMKQLGDLTIELEQVVGWMAPALDGLDTEERQALGQTVDRMQGTVVEMLRTASRPTPTATPTPTTTPLPIRAPR